MSQPESPQASDLCTACGLCCAGPVYNMLMLEPDELPGAFMHGLPVMNGGEGECFWFPCPRLEGKCCAIYDVRPGGCRTFRCELLLKLDRAQVTLDEAMGHVRDAWARVHRLEPLLDGESIPQLRRRRADLRAIGEVLPDEELRDRLNEMDEVLDAHFRRPPQNQRNAYAEVEGRERDDIWVSVTVDRREINARSDDSASE